MNGMNSAINLDTSTIANNASISKASFDLFKADKNTKELFTKKMREIRNLQTF